jgi:Flp pilus assembly protein TadD
MPASIAALVAGAAVFAACILPALVLASQVRLSEATSAYASADCARADQLAQHSIAVLATRAPPWQIEALCAVRAGRYRLAQARLRAGLEQDPGNWQLHAALAATTAAAGSDARTPAAIALRLNPLDPSVQALARALTRGPKPAARQAALGFLSEQSLIESG